jgi:hypothetical protein
MSSNFANQILAAINQVVPNGVLFLRDEDYLPTGRNILLSFGFKVAQLDSVLSERHLTSSYKFPSARYVAFKDNSTLERFLHESGYSVLYLSEGIEGLKLLGRSLNQCGAHRRQFDLGAINEVTGAPADQIKKEVKQWTKGTDQLYLRRLATKRGHIEV